jgi:hypothetical protein
MALEIKKRLRKKRVRTYLARDFDGFRADLLRYAKTYFPDKIADFSEASVGGLLLDMAAIIGDNMSFYLDHQFNELQWDTAVESKNIRRHIENSGIRILGSSPAAADVMFYIEVPSQVVSGIYGPKDSSLPTILEGTAVSGGGITFNLTEDIDFSEKDIHGAIKANFTVGASDASSKPQTYILSKSGVCVSGQETTESWDISNISVPFRKVSLGNTDVTEILSVEDREGNVYHEVESLAQDTAYKWVTNLGEDQELVKENLEVVPAPYRFIKQVNTSTRKTSIQFGAGDAESTDDDIIPDPSELSLPLYGKKSLSRFSLDPNKLLETQTLGISPRNTKLFVRYRHGGGLRHNVGASIINQIATLMIEWRVGSPTAEEMNLCRATISCGNPEAASGGEMAPTLEELRKQIPSARQMQSRIVTKQDLLSRLYTLPAQFGRVFRAGIRSNPNNHLATQLFLISRDADKRLTFAPDALKKNLRLYLNEYRLISDAIDVLDAQVINYTVDFDIVVNPKANKSTVVQNVISNLQKVLKIDNFQIDQPIMLVDLINVIINSNDVLSLVDLSVRNIRGPVEGREYSGISLNFSASTYKGMIVGTPGSIFELRYPDQDIIGSAS